MDQTKLSEQILQKEGCALVMIPCDNHWELNPAFASETSVHPPLPWETTRANLPDHIFNVALRCTMIELRQHVGYLHPSFTTLNFSLNEYGGEHPYSWMTRDTWEICTRRAVKTSQGLFSAELKPNLATKCSLERAW